MKLFIAQFICLCSFIASVPPSESSLSTPPADVMNNLIKDDPKAFFIKGLSQTKKVSCADILLGLTPPTSDGAVNLILQQTYALCLMELAMQQYIVHYQKILQDKAEQKSLQEVKNSLLFVQRLLPPLLIGYAITDAAFKNNDLRSKIFDFQQDYFQKNGGDF